MKRLALTLVTIALFSRVGGTSISAETSTLISANTSTLTTTSVSAGAVYLKGADFDGDGKADLVVYRPTTGEWFVRYSSSSYSYTTWTSYGWGLPGDVPLVADFDGDRKTDLVVYRPSTGEWFVRYSSSSYSYTTWTSYGWGLPGDVPM